MKGLPKTFKDIFEVIDESLQKERIIPGLILIYAGIDNFSNLAETRKKSGGPVFMEWVKRWMLEKYPLPCTETDLWSARCGLLHQQISESDLTRGQKAREIYYAHGGADPKALQDAIEFAQKNAVTVVVEDLLSSFKHGMMDCLSEIEKNIEWEKSFRAKAIKLFVTNDPFI